MFLRRAWVAALVMAPVMAVAQEAPLTMDVTPAQLAADVAAKKTVIVDVRERSELEGGMVEGARWYPMSAIAENEGAYLKFIASIPRTQAITFYCAAGGRAGRAADVARKLGRRTQNLGGFGRWKGAGLPVTVPPKDIKPG